jgi:hypothetical protein
MDGVAKFVDLNLTINKRLENWESEYEKILHLTN